MSKQILYYLEVLEKFDKAKLNYCILRNYEFLQGQNYPVEGLDTLISRADLPRLHDLLISLGFTRRIQQFSQSHHAYFKLVDRQMVSFDVQVGGIHWNDLLYLGEEVLKNRVRKTFYIPSDNDTYVMLIAHSILGKRGFKPKYQNILDNLTVDESYVQTKLKNIFGASSSNLLSKIKDKQFNNIPCYRLATFYALRPSYIFIFTKLFFRWIIWKRPFLPRPLISVLGPDGAGKSTLVRVLNEHLQSTGRNTATVYTGRGRGHILPITKLGKVYKRKEKKKDSATHRKPSLKRKLLYTLTAPIYTLDLLLRYYIQIFPQRIKKRIVLTDRYGSDIMLMRHVPLRLRRFLLSLFPKPTIQIFLYNDPEILHQRRPEENIPGLERQLSIYHQFNYSLKLKTDDKEAVQTQAIEFVMRELLRRWD